jgi:excisionase family DNA binding protein
MGFLRFDAHRDFCFYLHARLNAQGGNVTDRLLWSKRESASALGISVRTLENLLSVRELKSVRVGRRRMISQNELERFARHDHTTKPRAINGGLETKSVHSTERASELHK